MRLHISLLVASAAALPLQGIHPMRVHRARVSHFKLCTPYELTDYDIEQLLSNKE